MKNIIRKITITIRSAVKSRSLWIAAFVLILFLALRDYVSLIVEPFNGYKSIIAGVILFVLSQYILEFVLKPLRGYKNIKNEVYNKLKLYSGFITNPTDRIEFVVKNPSPYSALPLDIGEQEFNKINSHRLFEKYLNISDEIRKLSCDLEVKYYDNFLIVRKLFIKENDLNINDATSCLIRISNSLFDQSKSDQNREDIDNIRRNLHVIIQP